MIRSIEPACTADWLGLRRDVFMLQAQNAWIEPTLSYFFLVSIYVERGRMTGVRRKARVLRFLTLLAVWRISAGGGGINREIADEEFYPLASQQRKRAFCRAIVHAPRRGYPHDEPGTWT